MGATLPTLSSSGFVDDIAEKADRLTAYYFVSEASQSNLFLGNITSLTSQVQIHGHDENQLVQAIEGDLSRYFGPFFDLVDVTATAAVPDPAEPGRLNLRVGVIVTEGGQQYSLGRLITVVNSKISKIVDINNNTGAIQP